MVTHNTDFFRFALPEAEQPLGLPVASCLLVRCTSSKRQLPSTAYKYVGTVRKWYPG